MRKRLAFSAVAVLLISGSVAQAQLSYGAKLGMGFPQMRDDAIGSQRITLAIGLTGSLKIVEGIQLISDIGYQRKGNKYNNPYTNAKPDSTYMLKTNLDYINVPLSLKINLGRSSKFYFQAGGYYGYLVHANFTGRLSGKMVTRENIISGLYRSDYGILLGGGIETPIRPGFGVILDVKYSFGMRNLNQDAKIIGNSDPIRNKGLTMSMGFYVDVD